MSKLQKTMFILYVHDQEASRNFFERVLGMQPTLHVPGMTEFSVGQDTKIGLMPARGMAALLNLDEDQVSAGGYRGEVYLVVAAPEEYHQRALAAGATELSALAPRDWGDEAAYSLDPNGYVLAFARPLP